MVTTDLPLSGSALPDTESWARVYEVPSGSECGPPLPVNANVRLALHPTLPQLAVSDSTAIRIVEVYSGLEVTRWHRPDTSRLKWSPDGRQLLAASDTDFQIRRWDVIRRSPLTTLAGHAKPVDFVFNHRGDVIVSHDLSGDVRLWDAWSGRMSYQDGASVPTMRFSPDDKLFAATGGVTPKLRLLPWPAVANCDVFRWIHRKRPALCGPYSIRTAASWQLRRGMASCCGIFCGTNDWPSFPAIGTRCHSNRMAHC